MAIRSPKRAALAANSLNYNGVDLTSPAPVKLPAFTSDPNSIASAVQSGTDQANAANQQRYGQGLGVLTNGATSAQNYIQSAITNSDKVGQSARDRVGVNLQNAQGNTLQSAVSRGLGNTTILDSLQRGNARDAETANQSIDEQLADRKSSLNLQQAGQANQGANSIAGFIAARNDVAPDLGLYSSLAQKAAASTAGAKQSGTTINAPASYTGGLGSSGGSGIKAPSSGGGSSSGTYFNNAASGGGGAIGGNQGGYYSGGTAAPAGGSISSAISQPAAGGDSNFSPYMASQGYGKGTTSITPTGSVMNDAGNTLITPLPDAPAAGAPAPKKDIYSFFGVPFGSLLTDDMYKKFAAAQGK
jgi:hypothetical protein